MASSPSREATHTMGITLQDTIHPAQPSLQHARADCWLLPGSWPALCWWRAAPAQPASKSERPGSVPQHTDVGCAHHARGQAEGHSSDRAQLRACQVGRERTPTGMVASKMMNWNQITHLSLATMSYQHMLTTAQRCRPATGQIAAWLLTRTARSNTGRSHNTLR